MKPLAIDLYCGLGGWSEALISEGWRVVGFDIERHDYGTGVYPGQLVLQDVTMLHGSQFKDASLIVASPPCQEYSYMAMPWSRAKERARKYRAGELDVRDLTRLFDACFRIQRESCEAAGRHIPLIVENVRGAQPWVGRAKWNFGSYYLWGDVPALMPITLGRAVMKNGVTHRSDGRTNWHGDDSVKVPGLADGHFPPGGLAQGYLDSEKRPGRNFHAYENGLGSSPSSNGASHETRGVKLRDPGGYGRTHPAAFGWKSPRTSSSAKNSRKAASAHIAKIPFPLAQHIARIFRETQRPKREAVSA